MSDELGFAAVALHLAVRGMLAAAVVGYVLFWKSISTGKYRWAGELSAACIVLALLNQFLLAVFISVREVTAAGEVFRAAPRLFLVLFADPLWFSVIIFSIMIIAWKSQKRGNESGGTGGERKQPDRDRHYLLPGAFIIGALETAAVYAGDEIYLPAAYAYMYTLLVWIAAGVIIWGGMRLWRRRQRKPAGQ